MSPYPVVPFGSNKTNPTAGVIAAAAALLLTAGCAPIDDTPALASESLFTRIIRGTTVCSDTDNDGAYCGTEHWTLYVHEDGSRYLHVVGDNPRENGVRHGVVRLNSAGAVEQAFASITRDGAFIGSSLATMADEGGLAAVDDTRFEGDNATFRIEEIPTLGPATSIGTGPAAGDGIHFMTYDQAAGGPQQRPIYWISGRYGSMVGASVMSENTLVGKETVTLADGSQHQATRFKMVSGTEVWVKEPDFVLLRMDLQFGAAGRRFDTLSLDVMEKPRP